MRDEENKLGDDPFDLSDKVASEDVNDDDDLDDDFPDEPDVLDQPDEGDSGSAEEPSGQEPGDG